MITDMLANEDIAGSINRTNESIIKRQRRELAEKDKILKEKEKAHQRELQEKEKTYREELQEKEKTHREELQEKEKTHREELQEKDALIRELQQQLAAKKPD